MARDPVFYSFHYDNDVFRTQQIRNMGVVEGDEPVSPNDWEQIKRRGDQAVERWIEESMKYKRCVIVLVGSETSTRRWVRHEIERAYSLSKGLFGIYIHNLKCPRVGRCSQGVNPFDGFTINNGGQRLSSVIPCYDPGHDAYNGISGNLAIWVSSAITAAQYR
ncbi:conserved hypothetical protein [Nitrospira sp. ND1]|jgi:hypothetical protein|uniref:TIR domain-containing protein n=1 Tax=Nitrospira sp. ND1 TaxID=1658518 RepID=UPI0009BB5961|nr:TIR domain-containing protein [Nitrospira sp. ND1]SLM45455.1 conserved hypothetical protein [Nitrospira sp. ND1]